MAKQRKVGGLDSGGYVIFQADGRRDREHVLMATAALGRPLPDAAEVHHVNGIPSDNRPGNLVICPDHAYHFLLHQRTRALESCGHADWRICYYCKKYDAPTNLLIRHQGVYHRDCFNAYNRRRHAEKRATGWTKTYTPYKRRSRP